MPLTTAEIASLHAYQPKAVSPRRYVIIGTKGCTSHTVAEVLMDPPFCGRCNVKIAGNPLQAAGFVAAIKAEQQDYAQEMARSTYKPSVGLWNETRLEVNFKREGTQEQADANEVVANIEVGATRLMYRDETDSGKLFSTRNEADEYLNDPLHRSDVSGYTDRVPTVYLEGESGYGVEVIGEGRTVSTYYLNDSQTACKYCKTSFHAENFVAVPCSPEYNDQSLVIAIMTHYYTCAMIRQFVRKAQRAEDAGWSDANVLPVEDVTLAGDAYTKASYVIPGSARNSYHAFNHIMYGTKYTSV